MKGIKDFFLSLLKLDEWHLLIILLLICFALQEYYPSNMGNATLLVASAILMIFLCAETQGVNPRDLDVGLAIFASVLGGPVVFFLMKVMSKLLIWYSKVLAALLGID